MGGCCVANCTNSSDTGIRLFSLPTDPVIREVWKRNCKGIFWDFRRKYYVCEVHFDDSQFEVSRVDGVRNLKPNAVPTLFSPQELNISLQKLQRNEYLKSSSSSRGDSVKYYFIRADEEQKAMVEQRMTFVQARWVDEGRETYRGRPPSTRGRKRGRPRKRPNDDLDEWTPDRPRAVRGRKRGRPPASAGRAKQVTLVSPVTKAPRGRGRISNESHGRPGPKPRLEGPGPPPAVFTPGGKCFVCSKAAGTTGSPLNSLTNTTKVALHQKLGRLVGAELDLIVDEDGVLCHGCTRLLNYMDRIEVEHTMLGKSILNCMRRTFGFGYVQGDNRMPEAVLASIEDHGKSCIIPADKLELNLEQNGKEQVATGIHVTKRKSLTSVTNNEKRLKAMVPDSFTERRLSDDGRKLYECQICKFRSKYQSVFIFHLRQHLQTVYRCDFCNIHLPKGLKVIDNKNVEVSNGASMRDKTVAVINMEAEPKDYVETMIEELHTTGIVTTMKPSALDNSVLVPRVMSDIQNLNEPIISDEVENTNIDKCEEKAVDDATLNILLTFPNEKVQESVSVPQDVSDGDHSFTHDDVSRELRDIFGNFNDSLEQSVVSIKPNVANLDSDVKELSSVSKFATSDINSVNISNRKNFNHKEKDIGTNENNINEETVITNSSPNSGGSYELQAQNNQNNEDAEKYRKQLALLDEMGLIMLPKRNNHSEVGKNEVAVSTDCMSVAQNTNWTALGPHERDDQTTDQLSNNGVSDASLLKQQTSWLTSLEEKKVSVTDSSDERHTDGGEWLKSGIQIDGEEPQWLPPQNVEPGGLTETEGNWLLESHIADPMGTEIKESESGEQSTSENNGNWNQIDNSGKVIHNMLESGVDIRNSNSSLGGIDKSNTVPSIKVDGDNFTESVSVPQTTDDKLKNVSLGSDITEEEQSKCNSGISSWRTLASETADQEQLCLQELKYSVDKVKHAVDTSKDKYSVSDSMMVVEEHLKTVSSLSQSLEEIGSRDERGLCALRVVESCNPNEIDRIKKNETGECGLSDSAIHELVVENSERSGDKQIYKEENSENVDSQLKISELNVTEQGDRHNSDLHQHKDVLDDKDSMR